MQNELSSRIEKIWAMADIALAQGFVDYSADSHDRTAYIAGLSFHFVDGVLVRLRGARLNLALVHQEQDVGVSFFPGSQIRIHFLNGDDETLTRAYDELRAIQKVFTRKAA